MNCHKLSDTHSATWSGLSLRSTHSQLIARQPHRVFKARGIHRFAIRCLCTATLEFLRSDEFRLVWASRSGLGTLITLFLESCGRSSSFQKWIGLVRGPWSTHQLVLQMEHHCEWMRIWIFWYETVFYHHPLRWFCFISNQAKAGPDSWCHLSEILLWEVFYIA